MAKGSSKRSAKQGNGTEAALPENQTDADALRGQTDESDPPTIGDTSLTQALFSAEKSGTDDTGDADAAEGTEHKDVPEPAPEPAREPEPALEPTAHAAVAPQPTVVERRGPGLGGLILGGVVAAGLGYGAAYMGLIGGGQNDQSAEIAAALQAQSEALSSLQDQVTSLANAEPPAAPEIPEMPELDLSPVLAEIAGLSERMDGTTDALSGVTGRITALENRPVFTGEVDEDSAAMAAAMEQLQAQLGEQQAANEALADELRTMSEDAQAAIAEAESRTQETVATAMAEAETRVAEAMAQAEGSVAAATAQAALSRVRIAMASGDPFADALADIPASVEVPDALSAAAEAGVPTLEELQAQFPAAARAALPVALLEVNADAGAGDRAIAFLRGQFGGRAIAPRDGDDPDAVLSRVQAAVTSGDLQTAISELGALPEGAQAELSAWSDAAQSRTAADAALDTLATALDGAN